ncbi:hypothetical protein A2955_02005 [Candidatus Woesebacteria bacterium RIFCSPLOWO2_01_FULL_37_19]|uniref:RNA polymerase sigma-70 region 4 domain-containing protein n=1 Tax=Candidatus Woesebacteria bacterium RIFCSPLOWO2_01_FULL_37_19 TaxID=1802514 RepID=A0A1F8AZE0_9BACT|nr:MAG: hypothetical protein A2955_02005 [Candidatus Woesebacteria bacterium RIFCSPLOWO2_01_FULL_37_19]
MRANRTVRYFAAHIRRLPQLTSKEKEVLTRRLKTTTLQKIGEGYKLTEGRIRQIEKQALKKIKSKIYQQILFKN